jgi:hypothetical protein
MFVLSVSQHKCICRAITHSCALPVQQTSLQTGRDIAQVLLKIFVLAMLMYACVLYCACLQEPL